jgi:hypothetical protein
MIDQKNMQNMAMVEENIYSAVDNFGNLYAIQKCYIKNGCLGWELMDRYETYATKRWIKQFSV